MVEEVATKEINEQSGKVPVSLSRRRSMT
ncbi:uncharacterized protein G2W53_015613 [Senna tora]|uniref:Uncharacterized protein n=1 Tax=Senna tora TaxID=362788 RepID=A0A835C803_9FABA|nr:uncharacterized protein G2W53_015613 [Senna tora]